MDKKGLAVDKLNNLLKKWQKRLLLNKWNISIEIVEFTRKDFRQSGDIKVYPGKKRAVVLLTNNPYLDEEEVLVHELIHLLLWDFDRFCERPILKGVKKPQTGKHAIFLSKLESLTDQLAKIIMDKTEVG
jgi:hypothetical protein